MLNDPLAGALAPASQEHPPIKSENPSPWSHEAPDWGRSIFESRQWVHRSELGSTQYLRESVAGDETPDDVVSPEEEDEITPPAVNEPGTDPAESDNSATVESDEESEVSSNKEPLLPPEVFLREEVGLLHPSAERSGAKIRDGSTFFPDSIVSDLVNHIGLEGHVANRVARDMASSLRLSGEGSMATWATRVSDLKERAMGRSRSSSSYSARIVGGSDALIAQAPFQVGLVSLPARDVYMSQFCGGSIISSKWVLTAAHCVEYETPNSFAVLSGEDFLPRGKVGGSSLSAVKRIILHPGWDPTTYDNDIALLELRRPLKLQSNVREIAALPSDDHSVFNDGQISGWGTLTFGGLSPQQLQVATVAAVTNDDCLLSYADYNSASMLCAANPTIDSCQGDSGGPLARLVEGEWEIVGVVSFGNGCAGPDPGVYARVASFGSWIACWSSIAVRDGGEGPYLCGHEAGISSGDSLFANPGEWGFGKIRFQWFADGRPVGKANKALFKTGSQQFGQEISVEMIDSLGQTRALNSTELVSTAIGARWYLGKQFMPRKKVPLVGNEKGYTRASGIYGVMYSSPPGGFWAVRTFPLPRNTVSWTYAIEDSLEIGDFTALATGRDPKDTDDWDAGLALRTQGGLDWADNWTSNLAGSKASIMIGTFGAYEYLDFQWGLLLYEYF
jgi:hypothetical protein